jgi:hypothetical protein
MRTLALALLIMACRTAPDESSVTYSSMPHCGTEETVRVTRERVEWRRDHNCGGTDARGARRLDSGEWEALLEFIKHASFDACLRTSRLQRARMGASQSLRTTRGNA